MALVLLIATLIQPATSSHAQEDEPPPPVAGPPQGEQPGAPQASVLVKSDVERNDTPSVPANTSRQPVQPPVPAPDTLPVAPRIPASEVAPAVIKPQAPQPQGTFQVNIIASPTATADGLLTYSIYFTNTNQTTTYQNVVLQDVIGYNQRYTGCETPATCPFTYTGDLVRPTLLSGAGNSGNYDQRELLWSLGNVLPNQKGRISYTVRVWRERYPQTDQPSTLLGNTVALYDGGAINSSRKLNEDQWGVLVVGPIFYMTKTVDMPVAVQRDRVTYTISIGNKTNPVDANRLDARAATQLQVVDILPPPLNPTNIQFPPGSPTGSLETHGSETWVVWNIASLAVGETKSLRFSAEIKDTLSQCNTVDNDRYYVTSAELPKNDQGGKYYVQGRNNARTGVAPPLVQDVQVANSGPIYVGDVVSYTITVKNYWNADIVTEVIFYLPSAFTYVQGSASPGGAYNQPNQDHTVRWASVTIPKRTDYSSPGLRQFNVAARAGRYIDGQPQNRASARFLTPLPGGVPSGCLGSFERGVDVQPLLYSTKSVQTPNNSTTVLSGTDVIYTVELLNISNQPLTGVSLIDVIPYPPGGPFLYKGMESGLAPSTTSSTQLRWDGTLNVPAGSISSPGKTTLRIKMTVRGLPRECKDNRIFPDSPPSQSREVGGGNICIALPWIVTKTVDRTLVSPLDSNRTLHFTLTFESRVSSDLNFEPRDKPEAPYGPLRMVPGKGPAPVLPTPVDGFITWPPIVLHGFEKITYEFLMDLPVDGDNRIPSRGYCNRGVLWPLPRNVYNYWLESDPAACTTVSSLELNVSKWVDRHDVGLGELVTYGINLNNNSDSEVVDLVISDTLPVNVFYVQPANGSLAPTVTTLPNGRQLLRWGSVRAPAHATTTISFQARAPGLIGRYPNVAEVSGGQPLPAFSCPAGGSPTGGCLAHVDLNVTNLVTIDPQATPPSAQPGDIVTYTVSLLSNNNIPYVNTTVSDTLPLGFTFVEMVTGPTPYRPRPDVLIWNNQTIPPRDGNNAGRLTYVFKAKAPLSYGSFRSRVEASSPTGIIPTVDNAARVLIVPQDPAISLVAPSLVQVGSDVTFRISLVNPKATPLTGVTINHELPASFVYKGVGAGTTVPTVNGQTLTWSNVTVPAQAQDGTPGIVELTVIATAPNEEGTATSTVTASSPGVEIDDTYNKVDMIIAELRYLFIPFIGTPG
jgi:uncharacterized repeat protein (TIGR01451 family)